VTPQLRDELHRRLGYRKLSRGWAKVEILLGLLAAGIGMLLGTSAVSNLSWELIAAALGLFVLGGYLALAGHRSHLYQSASDQLVLLVEEIRNLDKKDSHP
jgi:hypothetical protein